MELYKSLEKQLKKEPNFVSDNGELKKWVVLSKAQNFDEELIELLLDNEELKEKFFVKVKNILVFNQNLFSQFLEQKNYLNDSYTQYKNKVGLTIDCKFLKQRNEVALVWPFKDCVLEGGQSREEDKREEIFFNEILAQDEITQLFEPKVLTNAKRCNTNGENPFDAFNRNEKGTITDNLIIKGNNLLALHALKKEFAGKVKLIYIDPPYNTGNDGFKYNDSFNHSTWLTFMKNRLTIARDLLRDDGVIFVSCDDREQAYLKVLLDEVYGRDSFIGQWNWFKSATPPNLSLKIKKNIEYILAYEKKRNNIKYKGIKKVSKSDDPFTKPQNTLKQLTFPTNSIIFKVENKIIEKGIYGTNKFPNNLLNDIVVENYRNKNEAIFENRFVWTQEKLIEELNRNTVVNCSNTLVLSYKKQDYSEEVPPNLIDENVGVSTTEEAGKELTNMFQQKVFDYPKPETLVKYLFEMLTNENDLVLDYHLGSGTTAAVAHKMNRQYIGIEQMDYIETVCVERMKKVIEGEQGGISKSVNWHGGGDFIYFELKKYNQTFMEQIEEAQNTEALLHIWKQMKIKSFLNYNIDIKKQEDHIEEFKNLRLADQKQHLCELLDKNQLYVNLSSLYDADFTCSDEEMKVTKDFYQN